MESAGDSEQSLLEIGPLSKQEQEACTSTCIEIKHSKELALKQQYNKNYTFEKVFGLNVGQRDVYSNVVEPLIPKVLAGYNCTVLAYGQTGTGKTYTMAGRSVTVAGSWQDDPETGIIPRALSHLFDELCLIQQQFTVRVSSIMKNFSIYSLIMSKAEASDYLKTNIRKGMLLFMESQQRHQVYEVLQKDRTGVAWLPH